MAVARWFVYNSLTTDAIASKYFNVTNFQELVSDTLTSVSTGTGPCVGAKCPKPGVINLPGCCDFYINVNRLVEAGYGGHNWSTIFTNQSVFGLLNSIVSEANLKIQADTLAKYSPSTSNGDMYISPLNVLNNETWEYDNTQITEQNNYYSYGNIFTSGLVDSSGLNPLNDIDLLVSGKFEPLGKFTFNEINQIDNIKLDISFWSVELGALFSTGIYEINLYKEIGGTITNVGIIGSINLGVSVATGNARKYNFTFKVPETLKGSIYESVTFNATTTNGITEWTTFADTVSNIWNPAEDTNYYVGLATNTISASGGAFIGINVNTTVFNSTGESCDACDVDDRRYLGFCVDCKSTLNDSGFWTT